MTAFSDVAIAPRIGILIRRDDPRWAEAIAPQ
jgi:hypothetical protein